MTVREEGGERWEDKKIEREQEKLGGRGQVILVADS